jgi:nucleoside-diphosphate-sugar epimerase
MKIAVLGANGFIGSYLCTYLWAKGFDVIPVTRQTFNLTNKSAVLYWLEQTQPAVVINAAISGGGVTVNDVNYEDVRKNLTVFFNFFNARTSSPFRYINIGSGAEFDRQTEIFQADELDILVSHPVDSYGFSKNIIARAVLEKDNFFTLRLFGCFHPSESSTRLFKRFLSGQLVSIQNKWFDYFSLSDFARIVEYYCTTQYHVPKDLNCVYPEKYMLNEILGKINQIKKLDIPIYTDGQKYFSYTGYEYKLSILSQKVDFPKLEGLEKGLEQYE